MNHLVQSSNSPLRRKALILRHTINEGVRVFRGHVPKVGVGTCAYLYHLTIPFQLLGISRGPGCHTKSDRLANVLKNL